MGKKREKEKKNKMRVSCREKDGVKKGAWTEEEDKILVDFITEYGHGSWRNLPKNAGLLRCGKSCRLRWTNYLRPDIKRGPFTREEENTIIHLHTTFGNKWAAIATHLPGRTDNDIKNFWNSHLRKRYNPMILNQPSSSSSKSVNTKPESSLTRHMAQWENVRLEAESCLSTKTLLPSCSKNQGDHFLRLWNSKVGESFRSLNEELGDPPPVHSPVSQTSSLTKTESGSGAGPVKTQSFTGISPKMTCEKKVEIFNCKIEEKDDGVCLDVLKSYEFDDSSESMLKLLLDFLAGDNDMGFLQGPFDNFSNYKQN